MSKKDEFKAFVKNNPSLVKYVNNNEMTWQKFYEMYDLYGNDNEVWKDYLNKKDNHSINDFMTWIKGIDLESVKEGVNSFQRVIGVLQDFNASKKNDKETYQPRPLYKHFDD